MIKHNVYELNFSSKCNERVLTKSPVSWSEAVKVQRVALEERKVNSVMIVIRQAVELSE
ncbi:MAG: hypothetical protein QQN63_00665 [Nitrosopumilus sp.]